jgi:ATP-binding cassette subfamily C protein LapB|tara:strand:- start:1866 stop:3623 length:1758 start_codon:yes stop_codon:yes gene_type:complete
LPPDRPESQTGPEVSRDSLFYLLQNATRAAVTRRALLVSFFINLLALAVPVFVLQVYDRVIFHAGLSTLTGLVAGVSLAVAFEFLLKQHRAGLFQTLGARLDLTAGEGLFNRLLTLPLVELEKRPASHWQSYFRDLELIRARHAGPVALLFVDLPFLVLAIGLIVLIARPLTGVIAVVVVAFLLLAWASSRQVRQQGIEEKDRQRQSEAGVNEFVINRQAVKTQMLDDAVRARWQSRHEATVEATMKRSRTTDRYRDLGHLMAQASTVVMVAVGALAILDQQMTLGTLIAANMLAGRVTGPLNMLVTQWRTLATYRLARRRLDELFALATERRHSGLGLAQPEGELRLESLRFRYPEGAQDAIAGLSGRIGPGGLHSLVGPNGSGKTTLLKMLRGLYTPSDGRVLLDDADLAQFARVDLARWIGYLPQVITLFSGSLRENITMGWPEADDDVLRLAAERACALDFIHALPDGFDTEVGEFGSRLSAGQRQRVALASVLLRDPAVLLLDEPTTNLDHEAEAALCQQLRQLATDHTVLVVTHSPVLLSACGGIIALASGGQLQAAGSAAEVLPKLGMTRPRQAADSP